MTQRGVGGFIQFVLKCSKIQREIMGGGLVKEINPTSWHSREALTGRNYKEKTGGR